MQIEGMLASLGGAVQPVMVNVNVAHVKDKVITGISILKHSTCSWFAWQAPRATNGRMLVPCKGGASVMEKNIKRVFEFSVTTFHKPSIEPNPHPGSDCGNQIISCPLRPFHQRLSPPPVHSSRPHPSSTCPACALALPLRPANDHPWSTSGH
jgi:hypothetical protein